MKQRKEAGHDELYLIRFGLHRPPRTDAEGLQREARALPHGFPETGSGGADWNIRGDYLSFKETINENRNKMTKQEFDNQCWHANMECYIDGDIYPIVLVDMTDRTVSVEDDDGELLTVPCKFVTIKQCRKEI